MAIFHRALLPFAPPLVISTLFLIVLALGGFGASEPEKSSIIFGFFCVILGVVIYFARRLHQPALQVMDSELVIRGVFGRPRVITNLAQCELVINEEWIEIRQPQRQAITIGRNAFSSTTWNEILRSLRQLPFKAVL